MRHALPPDKYEQIIEQAHKDGPIIGTAQRASILWATRMPSPETHEEAVILDQPDQAREFTELIRKRGRKSYHSGSISKAKKPTGLPKQNRETDRECKGRRQSTNKPPAVS